MTVFPSQPITASERNQIVARLSDLQAKQAAATSWGAAVGAREEEIRSLESRLLRIDAMTAGNQPSSSGSVEALARILMRCRTVLGNMAWENEGRLAMFNRWPISHEPLRADAKNLVPLIDEVLAAHHTEAMEGFTGAQAPTAPEPGWLAPALDAAAARAAEMPTWLTRAAVTPSPGARSWTPDQFWEYVGGLAGEFEAGQMRDMLAAQGLVLSSTPRATACVHNVIIGLDGCWHCQTCGAGVDMAVAHSSTKSGGGA